MGEYDQFSVLPGSVEAMMNDNCEMEMRFVPPLMSMPNVRRLPDSLAKLGPKTVPGSAMPIHDGKLVTILFVTGTAFVIC